MADAQINPPVDDSSPTIELSRVLATDRQELVDMESHSFDRLAGSIWCSGARLRPT